MCYRLLPFHVIDTKTGIAIRAVNYCQEVFSKKFYQRKEKIIIDHVCRPAESSCVPQTQLRSDHILLLHAACASSLTVLVFSATPRRVPPPSMNLLLDPLRLRKVGDLLICHQLCVTNEPDRNMCNNRWSFAYFNKYSDRATRSGQSTLAIQFRAGATTGIRERRMIIPEETMPGQEHQSCYTLQSFLWPRLVCIHSFMSKRKAVSNNTTRYITSQRCTASCGNNLT